MSEKRFIVVDHSTCVFDKITKEEYVCIDREEAFLVCKRLNEQQATINELQSIINHCKRKTGSGKKMNEQSMKDIIKLHNCYTQYELIGNKIVTDYSTWDLNTPKGREDVLTELRNLERKGLNMFALATKAMNNDLSYEEFHEAIKMIYDDIDRKNRNL